MKPTWATHVWEPFTRTDSAVIRAADEVWREPEQWDKEDGAILLFDAEGAASQLIRPLVHIPTDLFADWDGPVVDEEGRILYWDARPRVNNIPIGMCDDKRLALSDLVRDVFATIDATPNLRWVIDVTEPWKAGRATYGWPTTLIPYAKQDGSTGVCKRLPNVWLRLLVRTQAELEAKMPEFLKLRDLVPVLAVDLAVGEEMDLSGFLAQNCIHSGKNHAEVAGHAVSHYRDAPNEYHSVCDTCGKRFADSADTFNWVTINPKSNFEHVTSIISQCEAAGVPCWCDDADVRQLPEEKP